jgi:hypothetical protein
MLIEQRNDLWSGARVCPGYNHLPAMPIAASQPRQTAIPAAKLNLLRMDRRVTATVWPRTAISG